MKDRSPSIVIIGGKYLGCSVLQYLHTKKIDVPLVIPRKDDNGTDDIFPSIIKLCRSLGVKHQKQTQINSLNLLKKYKPDLILSLENNRIIPSSWINYMKKYGQIINMHFSPLPAYAGYWPEMWSIWNDEQNFGVTLHHVNEKIDSGEIIDQKFFKIAKNETRQSLYLKSFKNSFQLFKKNLNAIIMKKNIKKMSKIKFKKSFYHRELPNKGILNLDWPKSKQERFIRSISFPGYPGPKIKIGNHKYTLIENDIEFYKKIKTKVYE
jgi:methionyl-tRNA formyltransferase